MDTQPLPSPLPPSNWTTVPFAFSKEAYVPDRLPRLTIPQALRTVVLPLHIDWSTARNEVNLADRRQRARTYEVVLREGQPEDISTVVDGVLLADMWDELVLPQEIRDAWQHMIDAQRSR